MELTSAVPWVLGGTQQTWRNFFNGEVDDLRFYNDSLTTDEITAVFNDDVSSSIPAASKRQVIYDEGTDTTGLSISMDDNGFLQARIGDQGSGEYCFSESSIRDGSWHHVAVTFGDSPKVFKLYLDGELMNAPVIHAAGVISLHAEEPSLGAISGTSFFRITAHIKDFWMI